ncbi:MAG: glutamate synthase central domain-containing protein, partial [Alphaproteobacteria bacterium]
GNVNWMKSHETRLSHPLLDPFMDDIKPVVQAGGSDTATLDNVFELLVRAGRDAPMAKALLIPESLGNNATIPPAHRDLFLYCNAVMEPWDGPAAICATDGRWVVAGLDRNGLRPLRYSITSDGMLIVGSETGMVKLAEDQIIQKGRVGPGQSIGVDLDEGRFFEDKALKDLISARKPFGQWTERTTRIDEIVKAEADERANLTGEDLRRRQLSVGYTLEELESILHPMVEDANEAVGSMGDDTPIAVLSDQYRGLHHYFRQAFSQVTNPPIDSLRETRVMTLKTRLGNLGNILDEDPTQCDMLMLDSPVLSNAEFDAMRAYMGATACVVDCTFPVAEGEAGLRRHIERIRREAEEGVRSGCAHVILTDEAQCAERAVIPMILSVGAVQTHLVKNGLRTFTSLNLRVAESLDVHYVAVLIGAGATTVNAYLAQESIADRHRRGLFGAMSLREAVGRYKKAVDKGLLKIMSKMGI